MKKYSIDLREGILVIQFHIKPSLDETKQVMDEARSMADGQLRLWIFDESVDFTTDELEALSNYGKTIWPTPSKAAIVASDDLSYGVMRIHGVFRAQEDHETRVFRSEEEATEWLNEPFEAST